MSKKNDNAGRISPNELGKPKVEELDDMTAEDLTTIDEGDRPLPEG